jgi:hypothetical protein
LIKISPPLPEGHKEKNITAEPAEIAEIFFINGISEKKF